MLIAEYFVKSIFAGLAPLIFYYGVGGAIVLGCLAWAYFMPVFKKTALWVALGIVLGLVSYSIGVKDEVNRQQAKEANAAKTITKARANAIKRIDADTTGRLLSTDRYNRDR